MISSVMSVLSLTGLIMWVYSDVEGLKSRVKELERKIDEKGGGE